MRFFTRTLTRNRPPSTLAPPPPSTPDTFPLVIKPDEDVVLCPSLVPTSSHHKWTRSHQDIPSTSRVDGYATPVRRGRDRRLQVLQDDAVHDRLLSPRGSRAPGRMFLGDRNRSSSRSRSPSPSRMQGAVTTPFSSTSHLDATLADPPTSPSPYSVLTSEGTTANGSEIDVQVQPPSPTDSHSSIASNDGSTGTSPFPQLPEGRNPFPIHPEQGPRYNRTHTIPVVLEEYVVPALTTSWPHLTPNKDAEEEEEEPQGWTPAVHPDGALYFYHKEKNVYTDNYLYKKTFLEEVNEAVNYFTQCIEALDRMSLVKTESYELFIDIDLDEELTKWNYYCLDHASQTIFWLHDYEATSTPYAEGMYGLKSPAHMKLHLESAYWYHWSIYPDGPNRNLSVEDYNDLMSTLKFLSIELGMFDINMTCVAARLKSTISLWKFTNYHGQRGARLNRSQSVHGARSQSRTTLIQIFSGFLFRAPIGCLKDIQKIHADGIISLPSWKTYIERLQAEWQDCILSGTVLLTVNIAFLAVPLAIVFPNNDITPGPQNLTQSYERPLRSPSGIASIVSAILSIACMILGLLLVRYNRNKSREDAGDATTYMSRLKDPRFGYEPLAIIYSLPWALLMWAIVAFFAAMLIFTFKYMEWAAQASVAVTSAIVVAFVVWCVVVECQTSDSTQQRIGRVQDAWAILTEKLSKCRIQMKRKSTGEDRKAEEEGQDEKDDDILTIQVVLPCHPEDP
ncbi:hypothetical protein OF83DRAFT_1092780 [Amylostereum chailletii]|nr:hypothetical protein OF83DRAFT_1092780 [Amylostereum chailletii]